MLRIRVTVFPSYIALTHLMILPRESFVYHFYSFIRGYIKVWSRLYLIKKLKYFTSLYRQNWFLKPSNFRRISNHWNLIWKFFDIACDGVTACFKDNFFFFFLNSSCIGSSRWRLQTVNRVFLRSTVNGLENEAITRIIAVLYFSLRILLKKISMTTFYT